MVTLRMVMLFVGSNHFLSSGNVSDRFFLFLLQGTFEFSGKLYNQDSILGLCLESEIVISDS